MALCVCGNCGALYAPARRCPHCRASAEVARFDWEEEKMPKATVAGGPSNGLDVPAEPAVEVPSARAPKAELVEHAVNVAGVDPEDAQSMTKSQLVETIAAAVPPPPVPA